MNDIVKSFRAMNAAWMIHDDSIDPWALQYHYAITGGVSATQVEALKAARIPKVKGAIAVMNLTGVLFAKDNIYTDYGLGTSMESFGNAIDSVIANKDIKAIVIRVDSPGGSAQGSQTLGNKLFNARAVKPVVAIADPMAASAALYVASGASQLFVVPDGWTGSVGTLMSHYDYSKANEMAGISYTVQTAGKFKNEGDPDLPLTEEAKADRQRIVDHFYEQFVSDLAKYRGKTTKQVKADFGQGRMLFPKDALAAGMVDGISTVDDLLAKMGGGSVGPKASYSAEAALRLRERMGE